MLVRSIIELSHNLGRRVIAEGIEDAATLDRLGQLGCDLAQGYHIGRPQPLAQFEATLDSAQLQAAAAWASPVQPQRPRPA